MINRTTLPKQIKQTIATTEFEDCIVSDEAIQLLLDVHNKKATTEQLIETLKQKYIRKG